MHSQGESSARRASPEAILVIDDDANVLKFVSRMLRSIGYMEVHQASTADEAFRIFQEHHSRIGLIVSDFVMPDLNGDQLAVQLRKQKPEVKLLIMSGNDPASLDSAIPLDASSNFIQKPFTITEIKQSVSNLHLGI